MSLYEIISKKISQRRKVLPFKRNRCVVAPLRENYCILIITFLQLLISSFQISFMRIKNLVVILVCSVAIVSCNQKKVDKQAEATAILQIDSTWSSLVKEGKDIDKIVSYWSDDAVVIQPGQPVIKGKEALRKMVEDSKNIPGFSISWHSSDVQVSEDGTMAYTYGENMVSFADSTGVKISLPGRGYTIWKKENGNWKCVVDIWNNPPNQ